MKIARHRIASFGVCALALGCSDAGTESPGDGQGGNSVIPTGGVGGASGGAASGTAGVVATAGLGGASGSATLGGASSSGAGTAGTSGGGGGTAGATAGAGGGGGSGGMAGGGMRPSVGCQQTVAQTPNSWVEQPKLQVNGKARQWWTWLPLNYDPKRAYPIVFTFHGCGGPDNFIPMQRTAGADAIVIRGTGVTQDGCWTYGGTGEDVKFFDAMLAEAEKDYCVDSSRVFATGYSSGAWLVNTLSCARADKLRAGGSVSGGVVGDRGDCQGKVSRIFIHDSDDTTNKFVENGNQKEITRLLSVDHCMADNPVPEEPAPCARYPGCDAGYPVILCKTSGKKHDRQDTLATTAFWNLFKTL